MKTLTFLALSACAWAAPNQVTITSSNKASVSIPSAAPYSTIASWHDDRRFTITATNASSWSSFPLVYPLLIGGAFSGYNLIASVVTSGVSYTFRVADYQDGSSASFACPTILFSQDTVMRIQKFPSTSTMTCEIWNANGTNYQETQQAWVGAAVPGLSGTLQLGDETYNQGTVAFDRMYSGTVPLNSKPPYGGSGGDLWDYEFNNNLNDSSVNSLNLTGTGSFTYSTAATYPPACVMPPQFSFQASAGMTLNLGGSFPLNGNNALTYQAYYVSNTQGNAAPTTSSSTVVAPSWTGFSGTLPSSYYFYGVVTDSSSVSSTCITQKYGAVNSDANGNITVTNAVHKGILGPMTILNTSGMGTPSMPWSQYDIWGTNYALLMRQKMAGEQFITNISTTGLISTLTFANPVGLVVGANQAIYITGATGSGCSALNGNVYIVSNVAANGLTAQIAFSGCSYTASSAYALPAIPGQTGPAECQFKDWWNVAQAGTVTITSASQTITGVGTHFTTLFGQGNTTIKNPGSTKIVVWYPISSTFCTTDSVNCYSGITGRGFATVTAIASDTSMTVAFDIGGGSGFVTSSYRLAGSGLQYAYVEQNCDYAYNCAGGTVGAYNGIEGWNLNGDAVPGDYYDGSEASYARWYRGGIDDDLTNAEQMADRQFSYTPWDKGISAETSVGNTSIPETRILAANGIFMRAADSPPFNYWVGLESVSNFFLGVGTPNGTGEGPHWCGNVGMTSPYETFGGYNPPQCGQDVRDGSYSLAIVAHCAQFDPNTTQAAACASGVSRDMINRWNGPYQGSAPWQNFDIILALYSSWANASPEFTATVSNGSNVVTAENTYSWTAAEFSGCGAGGQATPPCMIWLTSTGLLQPTAVNNSQGDAQLYYVIYYDATHLHLVAVDGSTPVNYAGSLTSGAGWQIFNPNAGQLPGYYAQPYMMGIQAAAFHAAHDALVANPVSGDTTSAGLYASFTLAIANWYISAGINQFVQASESSGNFPVNGLQYFQQNPACNPSGLASYITANCGTGYGAQSLEAARDLAGGEGINVMTHALLLNPNASYLRGWGDLLFGSVFAVAGEPGWSGYNVIASDISNYMYTGNGQHKWWGYFWGVSAPWSWAAVRQNPPGSVGPAKGIIGAGVGPH